MFYFYAVGSMLGYTIQQTLLIRYARRIDGLSLTFYRNMGFFVTLLPLLYGSTTGDLRVITSHWLMLTLSGVCGALYLALQYASYAFLPAGTTASISKASSTIAIILFGWFLLGESLTGMSLLLIGIVIAGTIFIGFQHTHLPHLDDRFFIGVLLLLAGAIPMGYLTYVLAFLSREGNPLVAGYVWEVTIGLASLVLIVLRKIVMKKGLQKITMKTFLIIAACSFPTLIGTAFMSMASRLGPIAIVNAISSGSLVVTAVLAWGMYREKMNLRQSIGMAVIIAGIAGLKFV